MARKKSVASEARRAKMVIVVRCGIAKGFAAKHSNTTDRGTRVESCYVSLTLPRPGLVAILRQVHLIRSLHLGGPLYEADWAHLNIANNNRANKSHVIPPLHLCRPHTKTLPAFAKLSILSLSQRTYPIRKELHDPDMLCIQCTCSALYVDIAYSLSLATHPGTTSEREGAMPRTSGSLLLIRLVTSEALSICYSPHREATSSMQDNDLLQRRESVRPVQMINSTLL